ncbi:unnamed protein product [Arabidopsis arenosa]|uniref:Reverse transcriptase domain-containing protein n=1 Tax=Arabidopsis arenosa TaxID=38785 RepID=A0A8S2B1Y3_ARAAE|nr:unnamed protein product [Arabidopsis arenosa]
MKRKKGRKGWMLLKLDLEKAYDRIRWDFLEDTLIAAGLSGLWVPWIMQCVTGPSMSLLWNGERTESFKPLRGLRQGDPLSPYLFVLCMERLCHLIENAVADKRWKPISLSQRGPKLSHMCFADDLILFAEASVAQIRVIRRVLESFCTASGQKVSLEKSKIFFSGNVSRDLGKLISDESGIASTRELGRYLGMPILQKRINKDTYGEILEKMASRLSGWREKTLSFAGRLTLTRSVLTAIPVSLWSRVLRSKYRIGEIHDTRWLAAKSSWSSTWRSICVGVREVVMRGLSWVMGDGRQIRFWVDSWLSGKPLLDLESGSTPANYESVTARELWHDGRGWDLARISPYISDSRRLELAATVLDNVTGALDRISWRESQDGNFTVTSAYEMLTRDESPRQNMESFFKQIWKKDIDGICVIRRYVQYAKEGLRPFCTCLEIARVLQGYG